MRVGLVFGGRSVEHRVSVASARTVARALAEADHEVVPFGIAQDGSWVDAAQAGTALAGNSDALGSGSGQVRSSLAVLLNANIDIVFPVVHGTWGEDGTLQGLCEMLDLPYVGADVTASAIAMDKLQCKRLLRSCDIPVVDWEVVTQDDLDGGDSDLLRRLARLRLPLFVKPSCGGSSVGVVRVDERERLLEAMCFALQFDDALVVETGIIGRELECSVLGDLRLEASAVGEIVPGNQFYDYQDKYLQDAAQLAAPAELPVEVADRVRELAVRAYAAIGGSGMARVDFLQDGDGSLFVNEINTLPGFTRISMYPRLWQVSGLPLPELVSRLLEVGLARHRRRRRLDEAIREWLARIEG